jgi:hypothetical protein
MVAMSLSAEPFTTSQPAHVGCPSAANVFAQARVLDRQRTRPQNSRAQAIGRSSQHGH